MKMCYPLLRLNVLLFFIFCRLAPFLEFKETDKLKFKLFLLCESPEFKVSW